MTSDDGATTGFAGVRSSPTPGSLTMSWMRDAICPSPSGVMASPRNRSVATLTSPESPKSSSIWIKASATALPFGSVAAISGGGARSVPPAPSTRVTMRSTTRVIHGRTVITRLSQLSMLYIAHLESEESKT